MVEFLADLPHSRHPLLTLVLKAVRPAPVCMAVSPAEAYLLPPLSLNEGPMRQFAQPTGLSPLTSRNPQTLMQVSKLEVTFPIVEVSASVTVLQTFSVIVIELSNRAPYLGTTVRWYLLQASTVAPTVRVSIPQVRLLESPSAVCICPIFPIIVANVGSIAVELIGLKHRKLLVGLRPSIRVELFVM